MSINLTLSSIAPNVGGLLIGTDTTINSVSTDSRSLTPGALFVALRGPNFDGKDYFTQAVNAGAVGIMVEKELATTIPQILVADTQIALQKLAAAHRATLPGRIIAVTGSNGKTTTKELIAQILHQAGTTAATRGNLNNAIGLPLTLLAASDEAFVVVEMGANHPGEISTLSSIARPHVAVITNAGRAHLEGFGSVAGVARAKGEILTGLMPDGICILNADAEWLPLWQNLAGTRRVITFGRIAIADVTLQAIEKPLQLSDSGFYTRVRLQTPRGALILEIALAGDHNLLNVLAAVAVAEALAIDPQAIQRGIAAARPVVGRLCPRLTATGARLIDDSYNANPDSVRAALAVLAALPAKRRFLALGDLGELGPEAAILHQNIGREAREAGLDHLWATGALSAGAVAAFGAYGRHFATRDELIAQIMHSLHPGDLILVKGSHSSKMDQIVTALTTNTRT